MHKFYKFGVFFNHFDHDLMLLQTKFSDKTFECGTDEAGRGCLAGPVTAAAVILTHEFYGHLINDSKKLSHKTRQNLKSIIINECECFGISHIFPDEIDTINILNASIKAMHLSIAQLSRKPEFIIVDGNRFKTYNNIPHQTIVKGDAKYLSIAAASILAKTARDAYMEKIHEEFPMYNWKQNKGYPTKEHRAAIAKYGITKYHRKSFKLLPNQLSLNFNDL
jgi:ribonuclease HII